MYKKVCVYHLTCSRGIRLFTKEIIVELKLLKSSAIPRMYGFVKFEHRNDY